MDLLEFFRDEHKKITEPLPLELLNQAVELLTDKDRYRHVFGCRVTAVALALQWGADPVLAARAALLHDITKSFSYEEQLQLCSHFGLEKVDDWSPKIIHALTGSLVAYKVFKEQPEVVVAIRRHTTGEVGMSLLDKIIYLADYIEPSRETPDVAYARSLAFENLDAAMVHVLRKTMAHLKEQGREISDSSVKTLEWLMDYLEVI